MRNSEPGTRTLPIHEWALPPPGAHLETFSHGITDWTHPGSQLKARFCYSFIVEEFELELIMINNILAHVSCDGTRLFIIEL
jgi:hypothetical protein